jgi:hypothetical protein
MQLLNYFKDKSSLKTKKKVGKVNLLILNKLFQLFKSDFLQRAGTELAEQDKKMK